MRDREIINASQRERRSDNGNAYTKKYERTKKGKLVRTYRNMLSRVFGIVKGKAHLYEGLPILGKEVFYDWSLSDKAYSNLYDEWVYSDYCKKLSPSIDRIDTEKGYVIGNIRWLTHSQNSSFGGKHRMTNDR
jgi:hypothetical protein